MIGLAGEATPAPPAFARDISATDQCLAELGGTEGTSPPVYIHSLRGVCSRVPLATR